MIAIWIVIALFAVGDTAAGIPKNAAPPSTAATASLDVVPSEVAP